MSRPMPIICLTKLSDHEPLIRGLYALGYRYAGMTSLINGWQEWTDSMGTDVNKVNYPEITINAGLKEINAYMPHQRKWLGQKTDVNSARHFLSYARSLRANGAASAQVAGPV